VQLVVADAQVAHEQLAQSGVAVGDIMVIDGRDGGTLFGFNDPDGNAWMVRQIRARSEMPLLPGR
jgi:hypothetical protein